MSKLTEPGNIASPQHRQLVRSILTLKRCIRKLRNALETCRRTQKKLNATLGYCLQVPPEYKLRFRKRAVKAEALVKENDEVIAEVREDVKQTCLDLAQCIGAYDASPFKNWHEIAQLLGISHVLLDHFLEAHEDVIEEVSLGRCAIHHAEVWGEKEYKRFRFVIETPSRGAILCWAVWTSFDYRLETNSAFRYQMRKGFNSLFPGFFPPEQVQPERNFEVIADSLGEGPVNPTKDSQTELWP
jgi:hypothetical protein